MPVTAWRDGGVRGNPLTPTLQRVRDSLITNPELSLSTLTEVAAAADTTPASVVRFAQAVGYAGWPALRQDLRSAYLASLSFTETKVEHGESTEPVAQAYARDIANLQSAAEQLDTPATTRAIELLASSGRTLVVATGSWASVGVVMTHLGRVAGLQVCFEERGGIPLGLALNELGVGDVLMMVSVWRHFREQEHAARLAADRGVSIILITDSALAPPAAVADVVLVIPSESASFFQSATAAFPLVYGLLDGVARTRREATDEALVAIEATWQGLGVFPERAAVSPRRHRGEE